MLGILATDERYGLAQKGKLPWECPADMTFFKTMTTNRILWVSKSTFNSLPNSVKKDPKRGFKILTSNPQNAHEYTFDQFNPRLLSNDHILIGGTKAYNKLLRTCACVFHTTIKGTYGCDTFLIEDATFGWFPHCLRLIEAPTFSIDVYYKFPSCLPPDALRKAADISWED